MDKNKIMLCVNGVACLGAAMLATYTTKTVLETALDLPARNYDIVGDNGAVIGEARTYSASVSDRILLSAGISVLALTAGTLASHAVAENISAMEELVDVIGAEIRNVGKE